MGVFSFNFNFGKEVFSCCLILRSGYIKTYPIIFRTVSTWISGTRRREFYTVRSGWVPEQWWFRLVESPVRCGASWTPGDSGLNTWDQNKILRFWIILFTLPQSESNLVSSLPTDRNRILVFSSFIDNTAGGSSSTEHIIYHLAEKTVTRPGQWLGWWLQEERIEYDLSSQ